MLQSLQQFKTDLQKGIREQNARELVWREFISISHMAMSIAIKRRYEALNNPSLSFEDWCMKQTIWVKKYVDYKAGLA